MNKDNIKDLNSLLTEAEVEAKLNSLIKSLEEELEAEGTEDKEPEEIDATKLEVEPVGTEDEKKAEDVAETVNEDVVAEDTLEIDPVTTKAEAEGAEDKVAKPIAPAAEETETPVKTEVEVEVSRAEDAVEPESPIADAEIERPAIEIDPLKVVEEQLENIFAILRESESDEAVKEGHQEIEDVAKKEVKVNDSDIKKDTAEDVNDNKGEAHEVKVEADATEDKVEEKEDAGEKVADEVAKEIEAGIVKEELEAEGTEDREPKEVEASEVEVEPAGTDEGKEVEDIEQAVNEAIDFYSFLMESSDEVFNEYINDEQLSYEEIELAEELLSDEFNNFLIESEYFNSYEEELSEGAVNNSVANRVKRWLGKRGKLTKAALAAGGTGALGTGAYALSKVPAIAKAAKVVATGMSVPGGLLPGAAVGGAAAGALGAGAYGLYKAAKYQKKIGDKAREHGPRAYDVHDKDGNKTQTTEYDYANRVTNRRNAIDKYKIDSRFKINELKKQERDARRNGTPEEYEKARLAVKDEKRQKAQDIADIRYRDMMMARIARRTARAEVDKEAREKKKTDDATKAGTNSNKGTNAEEKNVETNASFKYSDLDLMNILAENDYEATVENLLVLKEGLSSGEYVIEELEAEGTENREPKEVEAAAVEVEPAGTEDEKKAEDVAETVNEDAEVVTPDVKEGTEEPKEEAEPELSREEVMGKEEVVDDAKSETVHEEVKFTTLKEAFQLGSSYFCTPDRIQDLQEKVALLVAKENDDLLFQEMVKCTQLAESFKNRLLNKYSIISENRTSEFLQLMQESEACMDAVENREPKEVEASAVEVSPAGSEDEIIKTDVEPEVNDEKNKLTEEIDNFFQSREISSIEEMLDFYADNEELTEGFLGKVKNSLLKLSVNLLGTKSLNKILESIRTKALASKPKEKDAINEKINNLLQQSNKSKKMFIKSCLNEVPESQIKQADEKIRKYAKSKNSNLKEAYDLIESAMLLEYETSTDATTITTSNVALKTGEGETIGSIMVNGTKWLPAFLGMSGGETLIVGLIIGLIAGVIATIVVKKIAENANY